MRKNACKEEAFLHVLLFSFFRTAIVILFWSSIIWFKRLFAALEPSKGLSYLGRGAHIKLNYKCNESVFSLRIAFYVLQPRLCFLISYLIFSLCLIIIVLLILAFLFKFNLFDSIFIIIFLRHNNQQQSI